MERFFIFIAILAMPLSSCNMLPEEETGEGKIVLDLQPAESLTRSEPPQEWTDVRVGNTMYALDTNSFLLSIHDSDGQKIYSGKYSERPEEIIVSPGTYDVKLHSMEFGKPRFNAPLFGDEQTVIVEKNKTVNVTLLCRQLNAGLCLEFSESFNKRYIYAVRLKDGYGEVSYPKSTKDYCFFLPGEVKMIYKENNTDTVLMTRTLVAGEMLRLTLTYSENSMYNVSNLNINIDTSRVWRDEIYNTALKIPEGVLSIEEAKSRVGEKDLSIFGFVIGGDATEKTMRIAPPFASATHFIIAPSTSERNRNNCFVVELPSGKIRDELNLVVHRDLLGAPIVIVGDVVDSYYGYIGVKKTQDYTLL